VRAAGGLLEYLEDTQKENRFLQSLRTYTLTDYLILDHQTRRISKSPKPSETAPSRLPYSGRLINEHRDGQPCFAPVVLQPLLDIKGIRARQDTIQELIENSSLRQDLRQLLRQIYDLG